MSRIGKKPIVIPDKVTVTVSGQSIKVAGPKGKLDFTAHKGATVAVKGKEVLVTRKDDGRESRAVHGLTRSLVANMVHGVSVGFERTLEINGVGFRAEVKGQTLSLTVGFSHAVNFPLPA